MTAAYMMMALCSGATVSVGGSIYEMDGDGDVIRRNRDGSVSKDGRLDLNAEYRVMPVDFTLTFDEAMDMAMDGAAVQCESDGAGRWTATVGGMVRSKAGHHSLQTVGPRSERHLWRVVDYPMPFDHKPVRSGDFWLDRLADMIDGEHHAWNPGTVLGKAMDSKGVVALFRDCTGSIAFYGNGGDVLYLSEARGGATFVSSGHREIRAVEFSDDESRTTMLFDTDIPCSEFRLRDEDGTVCYGILFKEIPGEAWTECDRCFELCEEGSE